jgi:PAS domain S-box-containing protein
MKHSNESTQNGDNYYAHKSLRSHVVWVADARGFLLPDLPFWTRYTGGNGDSDAVRGWLESVHPSDAHHARAVWRNAVKTKTPAETEFRIRRHDGVYRHFQCLILPLYANKGRHVRQWIGVCHDVTEQRRAAEVLNNIDTMLPGGEDGFGPVTGEPSRRGRGKRSSPADLTRRQAEIAALVAQGKSSKAIAQSLSLSVHTIERHRANIKQRLKSGKVVDLVKYAIAHGLVC